MTITEYDIKVLAATTAGRWGYAAERIQSDIPGVPFLRHTLRTNVGQVHVEVYSAAREWGAASVLVGSEGHLITPTAEMRTAFRNHGCTDMHSTHY